MSSARPLYRCRYGVIAINATKFPNGLIKRVEVSHVQFVPKATYDVSISTTGHKIVDPDYDHFDPKLYQEFIDEATDLIKKILRIYSQSVVLCNLDVAFAQGVYANFITELLEKHKLVKRDLSDNEAYVEYCKTKAFHASMNKKLTSYNHCGVRSSSGSYDMLAMYLDKNRK